MRSEEEKKEQRRKAQKKYYEKNKDYYRKQSLNEVKRVRKERNLYKEIIKEVREYIETIVKNTPSSTRKDYANMILIDYKKVLEILDKGSDEISKQ